MNLSVCWYFYKVYCQYFYAIYPSIRNSQFKLNQKKKLEKICLLNMSLLFLVAKIVSVHIKQFQQRWKNAHYSLVLSIVEGGGA